MDEAIRKRIAAKGWLSRAASRLDEILDQSEITETDIREQLEELEKRLEHLDSAQTQVECHIELDRLETDIEAAAQFRDSKRTVLVRGRERLRLLSNEINNSSATPEASCESDSRQQAARLPKLELPKFGGDFTEWQTFWDKFRAVIDNSNSSQVNKFTYLQSLLHGEAAAAVSGLPLTAANYSAAKEILLKRFGRPERIIFSHIQRLLHTNVLSAKDGSSTTNLWRLHDEIQTRVRSLQTLGVGGETYGVILTPLILHQLPSNIRLEWARVGEGHEGDLDFLLTFLYDEIQRRERSQTFGSGAVTSAPGLGGSNSGLPDRKKQTDHRRQGTASALFSGGQRTRPIICVFCSGAHYSDKCRELNNLDFQGRKDRIKELGLCFLCLGKHYARHCTKVCFLCKGDHNSVLCIKHINKAHRRTEVGSVVDPALVGVSYQKSDNMTTVMQVVKANMAGAEVNIMFDSGSDRSFISLDCAKR